MLTALAIVGCLCLCIGVTCLIVANVMYRQLVDDLIEDHKVKDEQIHLLRAEVLTGFSENQTLYEEKQKLEDYNKRLLSQLIAQNNQGCRVNPNNPNVVRT